MHAWIYQISDSPIEEIINEDTLNQGEGTDYDYCAAISVEERNEAIKTLLKNICNKQILNHHFSVKLNHHLIIETIGLYY